MWGTGFFGHKTGGHGHLVVGDIHEGLHLLVMFVEGILDILGHGVEFDSTIHSLGVFTENNQVDIVPVVQGLPLNALHGRMLVLRLNSCGDERWAEIYETFAWREGSSLLPLLPWALK